MRLRTISGSASYCCIVASNGGTIVDRCYRTVGKNRAFMCVGLSVEDGGFSGQALAHRLEARRKEVVENERQ